MALLVAALAALLLWWWCEERKPRSLVESYLSGIRGPGCVRVVIANDMSGSMTKFTRPRQQALGQLLEWVPRNLRGDDELAVVAFSGETFIDMPPTTIADGPELQGVPNPTDGTSLTSLLGVVGGLPVSRCVTSLFLLSDGIFTFLLPDGTFTDDLPDADTARAMLRNAGVSELFLLVPGKKIPLNPGWAGVFPYAPPSIFDGMNPDATGLVLGKTLASVTGQRLVKS